MNNIDVKTIVGDLPHMSLQQADKITQFIAEHNIRNILELGFRYGVSTCYMAAALSKLGGGSITTIDLEYTRRTSPNIEELLERIGERHRVEIYYEPTSYTWRLMKFLEQNPVPCFDLCYLDGAHSWFVDALAFFLVDRMLKSGGWIIFDDLDWTYNTSPTNKDTERVKKMPLEERTTPQVRKIYELLVMSHPEYHNFRIEGEWGFAQKRELNDKRILNLIMSFWTSCCEKIKRR